MKGMVRKILVCIAALLLGFSAYAQFYMAGDDPAKVRWRTMDTQNYQLIYPKGMDSLARAYGRSLETWRMPVGNTAGFYPGEWTKGKIPVVLHGYHAVSNGSVAWAPKRMDLYLSPDTYHPTALPWMTNLAIHEQRHVAQMQTGLANKMRPFGWFFGEMIGAGASVLYGGDTWMEGDAVVTETALSNSGRGRKASFLNYYMISMDQGADRSWWSWKFGSQRWYSPNWYALGYLELAGARFNYGVDDISGQRYTDFSNHIFHWGMDAGLKVAVGLRQEQVFYQSAGSFYAFWLQQAKRRGPFMESQQVISRPKYYTTYSGLANTENGLYAVKESKVRVPALVRIDENGKERRLRPFSYSASGLQVSEDGKSLIWSETVLDPRWDLRSRSVVRSYDLKTHRVRTLYGKGQMYNPTACEGEGIVASRYEYEGGTGISIIRDRKQADKVVIAPDGMQIVETAVCNGRIYATAITDEGFGILRVEGNSLVSVLEPQPVSVAEFKCREGKLWFTCDRNGVNELYRLDPDSGKLEQMTSSRYGASDYELSNDGEWLYYSAEGLYGNLVCKTAVSELPAKEVSFADRYHWEIADTLSAQESRHATEPVGEVEFSEEKPYRKFPHLFNVHSWAPIYFSYDRIKNMSYDKYYDLAGLGATALIQNNLGTFTSQFGYSAHPDPDKGPWRHSGHAIFTYTGWYPVIEARVDFNDRRAHELGFNAYTTDCKKGAIKSVSRILDGKPQVKASVSVYIPWHFNRGGWYMGLIPKVSYRVSNDRINTAPYWYFLFEETDEEGNKQSHYEFVGRNSGWRFPTQSILASVRGYAMQNTAESGIYPKFGVGFEAGYYMNITKAGLKVASGEKALYSPQAYAYTYMYLPGIVPTQGIKISAKYTTDLIDQRVFGTSIVSTMPRGLSKLTSVCAGAKNSALFTFDYGIPVWIGDVNIGRTFMYINRLEFTPHFDYMMYTGDDGKRGELFSAGLDACVKFGNILFIKVPLTVGVRVDYNGGRSIADIGAKNYFVGPLFNVSF